VAELKFTEGPSGCTHCGQKMLQHRRVEGEWICDLPAWLQELQHDERVTFCRSCHASIVYRTAPWGRPHPVNLDGGSHFGTCPKADEYRGRRREKRQGSLDLGG
jgi:hypothetical protein